jgi:hypothetical protein
MTYRRQQQLDRNPPSAQTTKGEQQSGRVIVGNPWMGVTFMTLDSNTSFAYTVNALLLQLTSPVD